MRRPENNDMEYLARLGFESVKVSPYDLQDLKKRIRPHRALSRIFIGSGLLLLGIVIGSIWMYVSTWAPVSVVTVPLHRLSVDSSNKENLIAPDTVSLVRENFIKPEIKNVPEAEAPRRIDSIEIIEPKVIDLSAINSRDFKEEKLKYMINSPVFYLHDMKVTDYTSLYFKSDKFVKWSGLSAAYSNTSEAGTAASHLKQEADYYLHEEIARAMLLFKQGKYEQVIPSLQTIAAYNKEDLNCEFYQGMCYYYKKNYAAAIESFDKCISSLNNAFLQEAQYYKAVSLSEKGESHAAELLFRQIAEEGEFYAEKAADHLKD